MKSTDLHLGVKGFVEIDHLGAKWSRNSVVAQSFPNKAQRTEFLGSSHQNQLSIRLRSCAHDQAGPLAGVLTS